MMDTLGPAGIVVLVILATYAVCLLIESAILRWGTPEDLHADDWTGEGNRR
jgi:hypothetical protein